MILFCQVVLVNGGTASTAELIAASLRDNDRAQLLGETTFGKGRTQRVIPLKGKALLLLSNTAYFTPGHQKVDKVIPSCLACAIKQLIVTYSRAKKEI